MIPQSFIQDLLNRVDIVDVVGGHVQLKKAGANLLGLCPFHTEKSPSFTVSPVKQFYHCFGCGRNGSAITFLMEHSGLSFVEAVEELANSVGMTVPQDESRILPAERARKQAKTLALTEVMTQASHFYKQELKKSPQAIDYLKKRGVTGEIALRFGLGYAPEARNSLKNGFENYRASELEEAGLVIEKQGDEAFHSTSKRYDRFRDRIMFPIRNTRGQVIGFGGRILEKGEPKYLNSPETPLFQKGNELYGLFEARQAIRESGYVLVVEGYMDVVALAQLGFPQVVATLGTACTPVQVQKLMRQTDNIIFSFDGDTAGRGAARRAMEASLPLVSDTKGVRFLFLPPEHDPDSYIREFGPDEFDAMVRKATPLSEFLLEEIVGENNLNTLEGRARAQYTAKSLCAALAPSALRLQILRRLAQITQTPDDELEAFLGFSKPIVPARRIQARTSRPPVVGLERQVLRLLMMYPRFGGELSPEDIDTIKSFSPDQGELLMAILNAINILGEKTSLAALVEYLRLEGVECEQLVQETVGQDIEAEPALLDLKGAIRQIRLQAIKAEMNALASAGLTEEKKDQFYTLKEQQEALLQLINAEKLRM